MSVTGATVRPLAVRTGPPGICEGVSVAKMRNRRIVLGEIMSDLLVLAGGAAVVHGFALVHPAAGWIFAGGLIAALGVGIHRRMGGGGARPA